MFKQSKAWFICFIAACFFSYELVQLHMLNALSPHIMKDLHLDATGLGTLSSTYLLADVLFLIPAGLILDRFSVRKVILTALGFCVLGTIGFAYSQTLFQASFFHFFSGIGNAFCFLSCMLLANGWFKEKSTLVMSVMITIGLLGGVIAQVPFSLLAAAFSWRQALLIDGAIGVVIWALNYFFVYDAKGRIQETKTSLKEIINQVILACKVKETWLCGFYTGLMNLPLMIISAMVGNLFLTDVHRLSQTKASFAISMISFGTIVGSTAVGYISERLQQKKSLMIFGALSSFILFSYLMMANTINYTVITMLFFLIGLFSSTQVLGYPMITDAAPKEAKGTAMGVSALIIMGLAFVLQPITGILLDMNKTTSLNSYSAQDFSRAFLLFPVAFFLSALLAALVKERKTQLVKVKGST